MTEENKNPNQLEECAYCKQLDCKSDYHHVMHCLYCREEVHSCCDKDNCEYMGKNLVPVEVEKELTGLEFSANDIANSRKQGIKIDLGLDLEKQTICNKDVCQALWSANVWKLALLATKHDLEQYKTIHSAFRILGLKPDKLDQLTKTGVLNITTTPKEYVRARVEGWEKCHPDTVQTITEIFSECMKASYTIVQSQGTKQSLKQRKEKEIAEANAQKEVKASSNGNSKKESKPRLSKYEKMKQEFMQRYAGTSEQEIVEHLKKMGITEETYK